VRILQAHEEAHEQKREVGLPPVSLLGSKTLAPPSLITPKDAAIASATQRKNPGSSEAH